MNKRYKKGSFGGKLASLIEKAGISKNAFCSNMEISKSYLFDMLNDRTLPSNDMQLRIATTLCSSYEDQKEFYDFTAIKKGELPADIVKSLKDHPETYEEIRKLLCSKKHSNNSPKRS